MKTDYIEWDMIMHIVRQKRLEKDWPTAYMFMIGAHMGLRWSDLSQLKIKDFYEKEVNMIEQKTSKRRTIPVHPAVRRFIDETRIENGYKMDDYIFRIKRHNRPMFKQQMTRLLKLVSIEYNLPGNIATHSLRKSFGRRIWDLSKSDETILMLSEIFNHTDPAVTRKYLGLRKEEINSVYMSLTPIDNE